MLRALALWCAAFSLAAFVMMGADKRRARRGRRRIPEATLLWTAALGGSAGELAGMLLFRHKTRHPRFRYGLPALLVLQAALFVGLALWQRKG